MFVFISHLTVPEADRPELERHVRERSRVGAPAGLAVLGAGDARADGGS